MSEEKKIIKKAKLSWGQFMGVPVDIVIPFHGQYNKVTKLIESIWTATKSNPYKVFLVDDASPNPSFSKELDKLENLTILRSDVRLGFGEALQMGYKAGNNPYVVFLHSDCIVEEPNWLVELGRTLLNLKCQNVRLVSAKTNNPGPVGPTVLKSDKKHKSEDVVLEEGFLPLYCAMAHRELFSRVGFIKNYPIAGYEDEEFAYRMKFYGFRQGVSGRSWIRHEGGATLKSVSNLEEIMEKNREKCIQDLKVMFQQKGKPKV